MRRSLELRRCRVGSHRQRRGFSRVRPAERGGEHLLRRGQHLSAHLSCESLRARSLDCDRVGDGLAEGVSVVREPHARG
jgi:hypothetical protein